MNHHGNNSDLWSSLIIIHHYQSFVINNWAWLTVINYHYTWLLAMANHYYKPLSTTNTQCLTTINPHQPSPTVIKHHQPPWIERFTEARRDDGELGSDLGRSKSVHGRSEPQVGRLRWCGADDGMNGEQFASMIASEWRLLMRT